MRPRQVSSTPSGAAAAAATAAALTDYQTASPATGATVVMNANSIDGLLFLTPAGTLATLTVTLPTDGSSRLGQIRRLSSTQELTALTVNGATVLNSPTTLTANNTVGFQKVSAGTWMRIP